MSNLREYLFKLGVATKNISVRSTPLPVTVTTRIITYLVGNPYKPSFTTVTGWGVDPTYPFKRLPFLFVERLLSLSHWFLGQGGMMKKRVQQL